MIDDPFSDLLKTNKRKENISKLNDDLAYEILSVVEEIPAGRVATYGPIAKLIGRAKNSRLVARVLSPVGKDVYKRQVWNNTWNITHKVWLFPIK